MKVLFVSFHVNGHTLKPGFHKRSKHKRNSSRRVLWQVIENERMHKNEIFTSRWSLLKPGFCAFDSRKARIYLFYSLTESSNNVIFA